MPHLGKYLKSEASWEGEVRMEAREDGGFSFGCTEFESWHHQKTKAESNLSKAIKWLNETPLFHSKCPQISQG